MLKFYLDRAEQAREDAEAATLSNVANRCRRSEAAWTLLAERAALAERNREKLALEKATASPA
ncbi:hypothetical protein LZ518_00400 [Sphingomonas sp. RB56-2]|uniref:Uncharacterized protein n=1 Tax=Sphingomonas brevis TaxID=2908206 RepID=A0ABT0S5I7_9SPHN|nr:hypothetical protein [Sphingomonas brevis]MCL6739603.1 hypothetical protein [Sphingomonas brevis]